MNVLYLTNNPHLGSTARILQSWLKLGDEVGVRGLVVVPQEGALTDWLRSSGHAFRVDPMPWPEMRHPSRSACHALRIAFWARRLNTQLIHCNEHNVYPFGRLLRTLLRVPIVCHVRFRLARDFCEWAFGGSRKPDYLLWTSQQQREDSLDAVDGIVPPERQRLVYLGLDLDQFGKHTEHRTMLRRSWGVQPGDIVIGTASALKPIKRLEDFIKSVQSVAKTGRRVVGVIAGGVVPEHEDYSSQLKCLATNTGLGDQLIFLGHLEPVEPFLHAIDIFVSTSEYETFGNSVLEAMACRRPVVAYRGGSVGEVLGEAGYVVETGNLDRLQSALTQLVGDPILRASYGERARARVADCFRPENSYRQVREIYQSLVPRAVFT